VPEKESNITSYVYGLQCVLKVIKFGDFLTLRAILVFFLRILGSFNGHNSKTTY